MKIVIAEKISASAVDLLREPRWIVITPDQMEGGLAAQLESADALIVRSAVQVNAELLVKARKLRVIGRAGVGVDNIDLEPATRQGIAVMNTPGANAVAVAEHTLAMMLALARHLCRANELMHAGKWEKKSLQGSELRGKTLGIVGLGRIGLEVARRASSFGMHLIGYDPFVAPPVIARENNVALVPIDEIFKSSDFLTLHVGLTTQTEGLINQTSIRIMKKGIAISTSPAADSSANQPPIPHKKEGHRIINCARGELIVEQALADAIKSGHVAGAALDVFHQEPLKESPFFNLDNVILSPHIAGATDEAQEAIGIQLAMQVRDYLKLGVVQNAVTLPSLSHEEYIEVAPYIDMAERLGQFLSHATPGNLENIQITYNGRLAAGKTDLIRNAAIAGIFSGADGGSTANRINAAAIAAERGIRIQEDKKEFTIGGAGSVLKIVLHSSAGDASASATVLHGTSPRLLTYDGIDIEAPLHGTLVSIRNHDVPGVVGRIGTILGEQQVNIANFALSRAADTARAQGTQARSQRVPQGQALAVVQIDVPNAASATAAVEALRKVEAIASVRLIELAKL